ncbi:MAG: hypothetical protein QM784_18455 [Polyangiaceae bacterium]
MILRGVRFELEKIANGLADGEALGPLSRILGRRRGTPGKAEPENLDRRGHRVGGVHAAARARAGTGMMHDVETFRFVDATSNELAIALKGAHDVELLAGAATPRTDRSTVNHDPRSIEAGHRDHASGHVLVTTWQRDDSIVPMCRNRGLDGIGNEIARLKGVTHSVGAHGNPIGNTDCVEPHPHETRLHDALLDEPRELQQMHVTWVTLVPHAPDPNLGLLQICLR